MRLYARPESRHYHGARPSFNPRERHPRLKTRHSLSSAPLDGSRVLLLQLESRHCRPVVSLAVYISHQKVGCSVHCGELMMRNRVASVHSERWKVHSLDLSRRSLVLLHHSEGFSRHSLFEMYCKGFLTRHSKLLARHYDPRMARRKLSLRHS